MVRRYILVLMVSVFLTQCLLDLPELPIEYYISVSCFPKYGDSADLKKLKEDEIQAIMDGAEELNKATCGEFSRFAGYDSDDWFNKDDLQDGKLVIYCVWDDENPDVEWLQNCKKCVRFSGYGAADIILVRKGISNEAAIRYAKTYPNPINRPNPREYYLKIFKAIVTHEFGHRLYWSHNNEDILGASVMNGVPSSFYFAFTPTKLDIEGDYRVDGLCDVYDCPPADECPTRPAF